MLTFASCGQKTRNGALMKTDVRWVRAVASASAPLMLWASACSSPAGSAPLGTSGGGGGVAGTSGMGGSSGGLVAPGSGGGGIFMPGSGGSSGGNGLPDGGCFATSSAAEQVVTYETVTMEVTVNRPVALYIMLDQSGSMLGNKWTAAVGAIQTFLRDPRSTDLDVAFQLFSVSFLPPSGCGLCDGSDCQVPLVPMGRLPPHAPMVEAQLLNRVPIGIGTPIEAGLRGGINFCAGFQQQSPDQERCVLVFITDGEPSTCLQDTPSLAAIAGQGFSQQNV